MQIVSLSQLKSYLLEENLRLKLSSGKNFASINKNIALEVIQSEIGYQTLTKDLGFIVKYSYLDEPVKSNDYFEVEKTLLENGFIKDNKVQIVLFNDNFQTYAEYSRAKDLENASMQEILNLTKGANKFTLSLRVERCGISNVLANDAYQTLSQKVFDELNFIYDKLPSHKKTVPFETALGEIIEEVSKIMPYACDRVYQGKTKYGEEFYHFYSLIELIFNAKDLLEKLKSKPITPLTKFLKDFPLLDKNLIDAKFSFFNEVTLSGEPFIVFTFKLNEETKSYLLSFENDYSISPFEDLAIYSSDKLLFASCTHEEFHDFFNL